MPSGILTYINKNDTRGLMMTKLTEAYDSYIDFDLSTSK